MQEMLYYALEVVIIITSLIKRDTLLCARVRIENFRIKSMNYYCPSLSISISFSRSQKSAGKV